MAAPTAGILRLRVWRAMRQMAVGQEFLVPQDWLHADPKKATNRLSAVRANVARSIATGVFRSGIYRYPDGTPCPGVYVIERTA